MILDPSVGLIFLSSILQRWGVYLFDMAVTQLFQITVDNNERNRVAAGQFTFMLLRGQLKTRPARRPAATQRGVRRTFIPGKQQ